MRQFFCFCFLFLSFSFPCLYFHSSFMLRACFSPSEQHTISWLRHFDRCLDGIEQRGVTALCIFHDECPYGLKSLKASKIFQDFHGYSPI